MSTGMRGDNGRLISSPAKKSATYALTMPTPLVRAAIEHMVDEWVVSILLDGVTPCLDSNSSRETANSSFAFNDNSKESCRSRRWIFFLLARAWPGRTTHTALL